MSKKHDEPTAPRGVATERLDKHASTSFEQDRLGPSPSKPYRRPPASSSYDPVTGRAARVGQATPDSWKQIPDAGDRTMGDNRKRGTRPGRW
jgi:hypothetical protein